MKHLIAWLDEEFGRRSRLAEFLGLTPSAISQWRKAPVGWVLKIEQFTGISRYDLRPDVYGPKPRKRA